MVFSDLFFLFVFIPAFALLYLFAAAIDKLRTRNLLCAGSNTYCQENSGRNTIKNAVLILFSLIFYAWGEPVYVFLMLGCVIINYFVGLLIASSSFSKLFLVIGIILNIAILSTFKYLAFFADFVLHLGFNVPQPHISLPIGISFYVFQSITYLVDTYRKVSPVQRSFTSLLLYISMFAQLIAGPIVRYGTINKELNQRKASSQDVAIGMYRFLIGLSKKVIFANQFGETASLLLQNEVANASCFSAWIGILAFTLQIYFDFSGYSDMAIGIGRCLGFHFPENFNHPYCCLSITEFWRRWHISLGQFFRDYVYIPMGGNRHHQVFNILIVWFLTGMWHGASWNFILWGLYFGIIVMLEKYTLLRIQSHIPRLLLHIYSLFLIVLGWGIFYFEDFNAMLSFFNTLFMVPDLHESTIAIGELFSKFWLWIVAIILCMPVRKLCFDFYNRGYLGRSLCGTRLLFLFRLMVSLLLLCINIALLVGATNNAFLYTRF